MQRPDNDRILTTHAGSLPRPIDLLESVRTKARGDTLDERAFAARLKSAVADIVRKQADIGVDIVDDGEFSKPSFVTYARDRLSGIEPTGAARQSP
jgi:5-methyltetrahydropteroyltriglutamate--homocysteine methyltransferase